MQMKYNEIIAAIDEASLFDLFMLNNHIGELLVDAERLNRVKKQIQVKERISYFHPTTKTIIAAVVIGIRRTTVEVSNINDGIRVVVPFVCLKLDGSDIRIPRTDGLEGKSSFRVGERVGFVGKNNIEKYGLIKRLNSKTATIIVDERERWRVSYNFIFKVIDGFGNPSTTNHPAKLTTLKEVY